MSTALQRPAILPKRRRPGDSPAQVSLADAVATFEVNALPLEVQRYLSAVATFELEGCAPTWRPETGELAGRPDVLEGTAPDA